MFLIRNTRLLCVFVTLKIKLFVFYLFSMVVFKNKKCQSFKGHYQ